MILEMFFGELQRVVKIDLPATSRLNLKEPQTLFYAIVKQCNAKQSREGFWEYKELGASAKQFFRKSGKVDRSVKSGRN